MISGTAQRSMGRELSRPARKGFRLHPGLWFAVLLVFAAQVAVVFWLGNPPARVLSGRATAPMIHLAGKDWQELLALDDPTLFALPHRNSFSGAVWVPGSAPPFEPADSSQPPQPLQLALEKLGAPFTNYMETNPPPQFHPDTGLEIADLGHISAAPSRPLSVPSTVRVEGDLAKRRLLTPIRLPPQTNSDPDVLPNTVVEVLVDALGNTFSPVVANANSSLNSTANSTALNFARNARFEPIEKAAPGTELPDKLTFGKLIFEWQTVPAPPTKSPSSGP
jgi:hypothetical protein